MHSAKPKVLHEVGNKSMLQHVLDVATGLKPAKLIIVYGHCGESVCASINQYNLDNDFIWVKQEEQLGTGHAIKQALQHLSNVGHTLVLYGDVPLIKQKTLDKMLQKYDNNLVMLSMVVDSPSGYGRVVRDGKEKIKKIVEDRDATGSEKFIREINTGFYILPNNSIHKWINSLSNNNMQKEYYLTDVINMAYQDNVEIDSVQSTCEYEALGINNKSQLECLERFYQLQKVEQLLEQGVTIKDKSRLDIRGEIKVGRDCIIDVNCIFEGKVILGDNVTVGIGSILKNVTIYDDVNIKPYSIIEDAEIGKKSQIGPYARIRPGTKLEAEVHIGNFVEVKKSTIAKGSKANHLTYIGDAQIGSGVNIGAGSVTCNYDGKNKFTTIIEDGVFIGSGTMMVAPLIIGAGGVIGAGSTITKNTPNDELTVSRARQITVTGWLDYYKKKPRN
ncbi:MAG: bifunctional UDP-N-acetylglucosamine diphosphorylase/glucosamine-1-phosphate N-acetyltransferase GlmU [Burkholderiales bacterium]|nr:bifunctional UDP-N-acetylglucosamine diphosphorylase/glucosamine-1-phosphate N-acetyltransferase GlmU [Burkholderiales bacterium]